MGLLENIEWLADVDEIIGLLPELSELAGKTILITGASGLICSAVTDILLRFNDNRDNPVHIFAAGRNAEKMEKRFRRRSQRSDFSFIQYDALSSSSFQAIPCDYIIHGASNAYPAVISQEPVETMLSNLLGLQNLFQYARYHSVTRLLFISSSEIYGKKENPFPFHEDEYGYIDPLNPRNSYSMAKRAAETLCSCYFHEYGVDSVIVRPGHIYGPTATPNDNRVSSAWAYAAATGKDIVMKSDGSQRRSYCYCLDCASAILKVLLKGKTLHAYNISNQHSAVSIKEMAQILAAAGKVNLIHQAADCNDVKSFNPMNNSVLDNTALQSLGWQALFDAERGFSHTIDILKHELQK